MEHTVCVFGDSVAYGGYVKHSWPNLLRLELEGSSWDGRFLYNLGIVGDTSVELVARFDQEANPRKPTKIIFAVGKNDSVYLFDSNKPLVEEKQFESNLSELIKKARKFTEDITFVGLAIGDDNLLKPYTDSPDGNWAYDRERVKKYDGIVKSVAEKNSCKYVHVFDKLNFDDFVFEDFTDGLHPNDGGHRKIFEAVKGKIDPDYF